MIRPASLQQRLALFLLLPVAVLLFAMISAGFFYARNNLLAQWREGVVLRLGRAAHFIDMRLLRPKEWLEMYLSVSGQPSAGNMQERLVELLKDLEGVERVKVTWLDAASTPARSPHGSRQEPAHGGHGGMGQDGRRGGRHAARHAPIEIRAPRYDALVEHETISLMADLTGEDDRILGKLEVAIRFDYLVEDMKASKWWQEHKAFLVDQTGRVLMCADPGAHKQLGGSGDPVELATLEALQQRPFGTLLGPGHPAGEVSGFFRLHEAPWTLVIIAPGEEILAPIIRFRNYYLASGLLFVVFILLLMRWVTGRTVSSIKAVAQAAERIARGSQLPLLPVTSRDEVGQLTESFNTMALQLEERIRLKEALDLAMEVQQSLLPRHAPEIDGLDLAGKSLYCDETGGDYFDFLEFSELEGRLGIVVGDVAGHGIGAALIMTTVRSLLRSRVTQPGTLAQVVTDVNRLLCLDTAQTASFMTLFFMLVDRFNRKINWVRAGHDPAIVYDVAGDSFSELRGRGTALGVEETLAFHEYEYGDWAEGQIMVIGTDGIWEAENAHHEPFGKGRLREIIRKHHEDSAQDIVDCITDALAEFRATVPQQDDVTLVVLKTESLQSGQCRASQSSCLLS